MSWPRKVLVFRNSSVCFWLFVWNWMIFWFWWGVAMISDVRARCLNSSAILNAESLAMLRRSSV